MSTGQENAATHARYQALRAYADECQAEADAASGDDNREWWLEEARAAIAAALALER